MAGEAPTHPVPAHVDDDHASEEGCVARELARSYAELVESHRLAWGIDHAEAEAKARDLAGEAVDRVATSPPDQLSWGTMATTMEHDPEAALAAWERVKAEARAELRTGHRTALALEWRGGPWERARFLALREAFAADLRPRGGVESALVDVLAESFTAYLVWTGRATVQAANEWQLEDHKLKEHGYAQPPRLSVGAYLDWTTGLAEAAHRRFLATLKMLHELRRLPSLVVGSAGQVNLSHQAVNVSASTCAERRPRRRQDLPKPSG